MFGRNWKGPWQSICAYANYFHRGSQRGEHSEPWYYYLQVLFNGRPSERIALGKQPISWGRQIRDVLTHLIEPFLHRPSKRIYWSEGFIAVLAVIGGVYALACRARSHKEVLGNPSPRLRVSASPCLPRPAAQVSRASPCPVVAPSPALPRFLTFYTVVLTLLYSLISYKTPWCG